MQPVKLTIKAEDGRWTLTKDGAALGRFSHLEQATHEAVRHARELDRTGQPAQVLVEAAEGKVIEIDSSPQTTQLQESQGPEAE